MLTHDAALVEPRVGSATPWLRDAGTDLGKQLSQSLNTDLVDSLARLRASDDQSADVPIGTKHIVEDPLTGIVQSNVGCDTTSKIPLCIQDHGGANELEMQRRAREAEPK